MNTNPLRNQRGVALVVVLVFLVLLSVFVVSFFSNSQDELTAAQSFTGEVTASHLADSAVAVVMGQIREATSRPNNSWASQPGMIRVYGNGTVSSSDDVDAFFKLYSSNDMIVGGSEVGKFKIEDEVAEGGDTAWERSPAVWTNLNEPVTVPIPGNVTNSTVDRYPILDPSLKLRVEGLDFKTRDGADKASSDMVARMPVRWLYVLKDGTLTAPATQGANGTQAIWNQGQRAPSAANPIVGRIAFWTDDETCKVNVNTAGGYSLKATTSSNAKAPIDTATTDGGKPNVDRNGTVITTDDYAGAYWDTPRFYTLFDRGQLDETPNSPQLMRGGLAVSQPVRGEFQRYPGHPSTTSLGLLFRQPPANSGDSMQDAPYVLTSGQLALLNPRLQYSMVSGADAHQARSSNFGTDRLISKYDEAPDQRVKRLYASVDEVFFSQPDPTAVQQAARTTTDKELFPQGGNAVVTPDLLEKMRFFLTAYSRAPELNLFGRPRVSMWPVLQVNQPSDEDGSDALWNASDRLIAFCSTIGPKAGASTTGTPVTEKNATRFLFQRAASQSASLDQLIPRNQALLTYLKNVTDSPFPGFGGGSFATKYANASFYKYTADDNKTYGPDSQGRWQILAEMFDYIRVVNLRDSTRDKKIAGSTTDADGVMHPTTNMVVQMEKYKFAPRGLVVPSLVGQSGIINPRLGFGRFPIVSEAALILYHSGYSVGDPTVGANRFYTLQEIKKQYGENPPQPTHSLVRAFLVFETFNPMQGYAPILGPVNGTRETQKIYFDVSGLGEDPATKSGGFRVNGLSLMFPYSGTNSYYFSPVSFWGGRSTGGCEGFFHTVVKTNAAVRDFPLTMTAPQDQVDFLKKIYPARYVDPNNMGIPCEFTGAGTPPIAWYPFQSYSDPACVNTTTTWSSEKAFGVPIPLDGTGDAQARTNQRINLTGTTLTCSIRYGNTKVYGFSLKFPDARVPLPLDVVRGGFAGEPVDKSIASGEGRYYDAGGMVNWADNAKAGSNYAYGADPVNFPRLVKTFAGRMMWMNRADSSDFTSSNPVGPTYAGKFRNICQPGDTVRSMVYGNGDLRAACLTVDPKETSSVFAPHPDYNKIDTRQAQTLRMGDGTLYYTGTVFGAPPPADPTAPPPSTAATRVGNIAPLPGSRVYPAGQAADVPFGVNGVKRNDASRTDALDTHYGDFDTGLGNLADGPFCNKADEGNLAYRHEQKDPAGNSFNPKKWIYDYPYYTWNYDETFDTFFTPNRQVPSAVLFGSLLAGRYADWQTLCFSPNPAGADHPGRQTPKDYLWLDLFTMPVVEPYAISEPFSTAGKINMNYQIMPFTHIVRSTGMRAALQPVRVTAVSTADVQGPGSSVLSYKTGVVRAGTNVNGIAAILDPVPNNVNYRYLVDRDQTLAAFDEYFAQYDPAVAATHKLGFFKSAAQICDMYLYPRTSRVGGVALPRWQKGESDIINWWKPGGTNALTGDNMREKPYADLYARLTTKSNTYCVHIRAQVLRQPAPADPTQAATSYLTWDEKKGRIIGEYRGSSIIERYIDPQDERFIPGTSNTINVDTASIDSAYRFRVLMTKRFDP